METKKIYEELYKDLEGFKEQYVQLDKEWKANFLGTPEEQLYSTLETDIAKEEKQPEWYAKEQEMKKLEDKIEAFEKEVLNAARKLNKELSEDIAKLENKIEVNEKHLPKLDEEIKKLTEELEAVKNSEEYKKGDEEALLKAGDLESDIKAKTKRREDISKGIEDIKVELDKIKAEREQLVERHGKDLEEPAEKDKEEEPEQEENEVKGKNKASKGQNVIYNPAQEPEVGDNNESKELTEEEKAKKEFDDLCAKAKRGKLTDKEADALIAIMQNPESYDKFGIKTGFLFGNSKKILKQLDKTVLKSDAFARDIAAIIPMTIINPVGLTADELYDKMSKVDREALDDKGKALWDKVNANNKKKEAIAKAKEISKDVRNARYVKKFPWLFEMETKEALPEGTNEPTTPNQEQAEQVKKDKDALNLQGQVVSDKDYPVVPPVKKAKTQERENVK